MAAPSPSARPGSSDPGEGRPDARVDDLLARMSLEEKLAQLVGLWAGADASGGVVAPMQDQMAAGGASPVFAEFAAEGLGHLTRVYGTRPVEPETGWRSLRDAQLFLAEETRLGIPAIAHEECLTGLAAYRAATFPTPLAWAAAGDPDLVGEMAAGIGATMAALGIHQGLAPVLDVVRDARWGRVEECLGEDPYLVGTLGTAYVRGLQSAGVIATLKHFVGYSASRAGRNLAPVSAGPREVAELLVPFEMAVRDGGARSVMHSYAEIDGLPVAADTNLLTDLLRGQWGFEGTVVADYFGIAFLQTLHRVAADPGDAAAQALAAGVDIELPTGDAYLGPLAERIAAGEVDVALVDRAVRRVLRQKAELGLLEPSWADRLREDDGSRLPTLDPPEHRAVARRLAEESVILLSNDGTLPLAGVGSIAVIGPNADRGTALFGCYAFVTHVLPAHPEVERGLEVPTVAEALRAEFGDAVTSVTTGCDVSDPDPSGFAEAVRAAAGADVAVVVAGDQAGLFGRGTSGEGCDAEDLELPGVQRQLVERIVATGTPVVLVLVTGRPYAVGWALSSCAAVVQAFFPGEEGGPAVAGVLSGRVNPSGRLPVSLPRGAGSQPFGYLHPALGGPSPVSNLDPTPALPFGHGLSYTRFSHGSPTVERPEVDTSASIQVRVEVRNTGDRDGADIVQLYGAAAVGSVTPMVSRLLGYERVPLAAGQRATVTFDVPTTRLALTDRSGRRVVEPGPHTLWVGTSVAAEATTVVELIGEPHRVTAENPRITSAVVHREECP